MATLQELKDAVAANVEVGQSVVVLIDGLALRIQELINNSATPEEYQALVNEISADTESLAQKVIENTDAPV